MGSETALIANPSENDRPDDGLADRAPSPPRRRQLTLLSNTEVAPSIYRLRFGLPKGESIEFVPGQYVTFYLPREGKTLTRSYSIYSSANQHDRIALLVKKVPHGFGSHFLCDLSALRAPTLAALAPLGRFVLHDPGDRTVVLVATGVGLAPFVPMLERLHERHPTTPIWLFCGNRYVDDMVNRREFEQLERLWPSFHFVPILSQPPDDGSWHGAVGHVEEHVRGRFPDLSRSDVYLCGANRMVNQMQELAFELGCPKDHVYVDRWGDHGE
jgi:ferredoxin-NADP reductase